MIIHWKHKSLFDGLDKCGADDFKYLGNFSSVVCFCKNHETKNILSEIN